jgi:hypothetical protein
VLYLGVPQGFGSAGIVSDDGHALRPQLPDEMGIVTVHKGDGTISSPNRNNFLHCPITDPPDADDNDVVAVSARHNPLTLLLAVTLGEQKDAEADDGFSEDADADDGHDEKTGRTSAERGNSKVGLRKMSMRVA